jgi:hyperosmotically inducible protein
MKTQLIATLLATAFSAGFAYAADNDPAAFRTMSKQAASDYKMAADKCKPLSGNAKSVCIEEAKLARARAEHEAVVQHNNTDKARINARTKLANADYALAKARCAGMAGSDKDGCLNNAQAVRTSALADARADRALAATTAADKCAQIAGQPNTGCLIDNRSASTATGATVADRVGNAAETAAQKTRDAAATVADKTERAAETVAAKAENAAGKAGAVVADSVITTKVKTDIFKEPELKSMAIHVETEKGVVMLSGFVDSKADAEKAAEIARKVDGVTQVKSAIKVK